MYNVCKDAYSKSTLHITKFVLQYLFTNCKKNRHSSKERKNNKKIT